MVAGSKPSVNEDLLRYQALTKLRELAEQVSDIRRFNSTEAKAKIKQATMIRIWLQALDYKEYLSREQREKIWYALIDIADLNDYPIAPILEPRSRPSILLSGAQGENGEDGEDAGTPFVNLDVDNPSGVVDSFALGLSNGVKWEYTILNAAGDALRKGSISAGWLPDGSDIEYGAEVTIIEIGDTSDVVLSADIDSGNIRLIATVASNDWIVKGKRYLD